MKPNWKDAPEWANYLAMDENGLWCWFEYKPYKTGDNFWDSIGEKEKIKFENWKETLEERPK